MKFFDLDGTICESRQIISNKMKKKLLALKEPFVVISGAEIPRIKKQMNGVPCIKMGQNGNDTPDWQNKLTKKQKEEIYKHVLQFTDMDSDYIHDRGCQISFSWTGHNAPISIKKEFDPKKEFRNKILEKHPFKSKTLVVRVAGTTCFDYNKKNSLKGDNLKRYIKLHKLNPKDCVYYGDNFDKGGNDESVKGIMKCVKVKNPDDLLIKLK